MTKQQIKTGDTVRTGVYVCGEWKPMYLARVTRIIDDQLCEVDKMSLHGGAPWLQIEQISYLRKEVKP